MTSFARTGSQATGPGLRVRAGACLLLLLLAGGARAAIWSPFNGYADVSAVQAEVDGEDQDSLREDYNVSVQRHLSPWVDMRVAFRYFRFDQAFEIDPGSYRKEIQPSAELRWEHPWFLLSGTAIRREVETPVQGTVVTNTSQAVFKTRDIDRPIVELRYDEQHSYYLASREDGDIRNRRTQLNTSWDRSHHSFWYTYSHDVNDNVVSSQTSSGDRHLFRWRGQSGAGRRALRLNGGYNFSHVTRRTRNRDGGAVLGRVAPVAGLQAISETPDLVTLAPVAGLIDGDLAGATVPPIDIGGDLQSENIGVDLGIARPVGTLHIYTDRPSGAGVLWSVWGSEDNISWTRVDPAPAQGFNSALNRYEVSFAAANFRYLKLVCTGLNDVPVVLVTEMEAFEVLADASSSRLVSLSHQADGRVEYRLGERWRASCDASLQFDENAGRGGDRARSAFGARTTYLASQAVTHSLSWQLANQWYDGEALDQQESALGYTVTLVPGDHWRGSVSAYDRLTWLGGTRSQRNTGVGLETKADLLFGLDGSLGATASRYKDDFGGYDYRNWTSRGRLSASPVAALDLVLDASYQESRERNRDDLRTLAIVAVSADWRLTRTIFARGTVRRTREESDRYTFEGLLSWAVLPSVRVSAQHYEIGQDTAVTTLRQSVNLNWEITRRADLYLRLAKVDFSGSGGSRTLSVQQGLRIGF